ncbi:Transposon Ty3-G Gag-Pol polyprotein [Thelohanellus kitauei]|uniref:Transposon Ty3-G Gag-Pol polyprotein n=1 Tax=Thelohanellus kitauei TaxID=669202 RepID=A0A0C2JZT7_THEKT|nr:Transposon Ty3-G Gag-Pol polyprotein [Thelohanellus kitauei]
MSFHKQNVNSVHVYFGHIFTFKKITNTVTLNNLYNDFRFDDNKRNEINIKIYYFKLKLIKDDESSVIPIHENEYWCDKIDKSPHNFHCGFSELTVSGKCFTHNISNNKVDKPRLKIYVFVIATMPFVFSFILNIYLLAAERSTPESVKIDGEVFAIKRASSNRPDNFDMSLLRKIVQEEMNKKVETKRYNTNNQQRCYNCGRLGHIARYCYYRRYIMSYFVKSAVSTEDHPSRSLNTLSMLVDSGASISVIDVSLLKELDFDKLTRTSHKITNVSGQLMPCFGYIDLVLTFNKRGFPHKFLVCRNLEIKCIIGSDFLDRYGCIISFIDNTLQVGDCCVKLDKSCRMSIDYLSLPLKSDHLSPTEIVLSHVPESQKSAFIGLLKKYSSLLSADKNHVGCTNAVMHKINTGGAEPFKQRLRKFPIKHIEQLREIVDNLLKDGIIERTESPWASNVVLVKKKDSTWRLCVDYRQLNSLTLKNSYPLPRVDDVLESLAGAKYFSKFDLLSGYHQVQVAYEDRQKTAFITPFGLFQFTRMPFGLCNAPSTFQALMDRILKEAIGRYCMVYLDDIIIYSKSLQDHINHIERIFSMLKKANITINYKKSRILVENFNFLGHVISQAGITTDPDKCKAVQDWSVPTSRNQLQQFLGLASYYRKFVNNFARICLPLYELLKKEVRYKWTNKCQEAFDYLKEALTSPPILAYPDVSKRFLLDTDASGDTIGAVLSQESNEGERVIAYASRNLSKTERNYSITKKELLALVWATKHFKAYLYGQRFMIRTDHKCLQNLRSFKEVEGQMARWLEHLSLFDYEVHYRKGSSHGNVDALSRKPFSINAIELGELEINTLNRSTILQEQNSDDVLKEVKTWISSNFAQPIASRSNQILNHYWDIRNQLVVYGDILYRAMHTSENSIRLRVIVPNSLIPKILTVFHDDQIHAGHLSYDKSFQKIAKRFYWYHMKNDLINYCKSCVKCSEINNAHTKPKAPLQSDISCRPFERIAMDCLGPLPITSRGNRYIVVVSDYFTKWTEAFPVRTIESRTIAHLLIDNFVCRFGVPEFLHTDQGTNFESKLLYEICQLLGIKKTRTTPYNPSSDGMVERFNKTIVSMISKYVDQYPDWDNYLQKLMFTCRPSSHKSTKYSPYEAVFGREPRLPIDLIIKPFQLKNGIYEDTATKLSNRIKKIHEKMNDNLKQNHTNVENYFNRFSKNNEIRVGQNVMIKNFNQKGKFDKKWLGPFKVTRVLGPVTFEISDGFKSIVTHHNSLKPYIERYSYLKFPYQATQQCEDPNTESDLPAQPAPDRRYPARTRTYQPWYLEAVQTDDESPSEGGGSVSDGDWDPRRDRLT